MALREMSEYKTALALLLDDEQGKLDDRVLLVVEAERIRLRSELLRRLPDWPALHTEAARLLQLGHCDWALFEDYLDSLEQTGGTKSSATYSDAHAFLTALPADSMESARSRMLGLIHLAARWMVRILFHSY